MKTAENNRDFNDIEAGKPEKIIMAPIGSTTKVTTNIDRISPNVSREFSVDQPC